MPFERTILNRLVDQELIIPYFELGMLADKWPEHYMIKVDSGPYYGHGDGYFHPSTHPLMGERELYYRFHPDTRDSIVSEKRTFNRQMIFATGTAIHSIVQTQMVMAGLVEEKNIEVEYVIDEHHVRGRIDFIVDHPTGRQYLVELKTMGTWLYKKLEKIQPSWDAQLSLAEYAMDVSDGIIMVLERGGTGMREFKHHRNDVLLDEIFTKFARVRRAIEDSEPPRHCCALDSKEMEGCGARFVCWLKNEDL